MMQTYNVVGVRFKPAGKKYFFDPQEYNVKKGNHVLVETIRGVEFGEVVTDIKTVREDEVYLPLKPIIRIACEKDISHYRRNKSLEPMLLEKCNSLIKKNKLNMSLLSCEYTFDRSKLIFYFHSEGRVDFRNLVKDLANEFRTRIELRQVGVRDAAKFIGGIGPCGRILCCNTYLGDFETVSIKMAKKQNLALNPQKISGSCGKLLCCLRYESDVYDELGQYMPKVNEIVDTPNGPAKVINSNYLTKTIIVLTTNDDKYLKFSLNEITRKTQKSNDDDEIVVDAELKELEEE